MEQNYKIKKEDENQTIHSILKSKFQLSTRLLSKLIHEKKILLNGVFYDTRKIVKAGDLLTMDFSLEEKNDHVVPTRRYCLRNFV